MNDHDATALDRAVHLAAIRRETDALLAVVDGAPLHTPVPTCPGWDLARLCGHLGRVQRWAAVVVRSGAAADVSALPRPVPGEEAAYLADGATDLLDALQQADPAAPCWTFVDPHGTAGFWLRRQAHEALVHRWDAEHAVGRPGPLPAVLASDGIDEALTVLAPARLPEGATLGGSVHLHCTDVPGEWMIVQEGSAPFAFRREHAKGTVALRGPAASLLLVLWHRRPPQGEGIETLGDATVLERWLQLGVPG